jgi:hypothetical protein
MAHVHNHGVSGTTFLGETQPRAAQPETSLQSSCVRSWPCQADGVNARRSGRKRRCDSGKWHTKSSHRPSRSASASLGPTRESASISRRVSHTCKFIGPHWSIHRMLGWVAGWDGFRRYCFESPRVALAIRMSPIFRGTNLLDETRPDCQESRWTRLEVDLLVNAVARGMSFAEIASFLGRSESDVRQLCARPIRLTSIE